jgi:hypothetical protein
MQPVWEREKDGGDARSSAPILRASHLGGECARPTVIWTVQTTGEVPLFAMPTAGVACEAVLGRRCTRRCTFVRAGTEPFPWSTLDQSFDIGLSGPTPVDDRDYKVPFNFHWQDQQSDHRARSAETDTGRCQETGGCPTCRAGRELIGTLHTRWPRVVRPRLSFEL